MLDRSPPFPVEMTSSGAIVICAVAQHAGRVPKTFDITGGSKYEGIMEARAGRSTQCGWSDHANIQQVR